MTRDKEDATLLEWIDDRRAKAELARDAAIGVTVVVPIAILLLIARLSFAGVKASWYGTAAGAAGIIFLAGVLAAIAFGLASASRTGAFIDATHAGLNEIRPEPLADGDRVGDLVARRTPEGLALAHRQSITRLRLARAVLIPLAMIAGTGAGILAVMMIQQGSLNAKDVYSVVGIALLSATVPFWLMAFRRPLAVRMVFDNGHHTLRVLALRGMFRTIEYDIPYAALVGVTFDHAELLGSRRVRLIVGDRVLDIARFAVPRTNSKSSTFGGKREANQAHAALCAFRADRMFGTVRAQVLGQADD